ncbi:hypothetical protein HY440_00770 [Candidatus Microgenomates bacterium]|nr:hypothetical protein [Candidatus Microgenomates bacterium]
MVTKRGELVSSYLAGRAALLGSKVFLEADARKVAVRRDIARRVKDIREQVLPGDTVTLRDGEKVSERQVSSVSRKTGMVYFVGGGQMSVRQFGDRFMNIAKNSPPDWHRNERYNFDKYNPDYGRGGKRAKNRRGIS